MHSQGYIEPIHFLYFYSRAHLFSKHTNKKLNIFLLLPLHIHFFFFSSWKCKWNHRSVYRRLYYGQLFENCEKCNLNLHVKCHVHFRLAFMRLFIDRLPQLIHRIKQGKHSKMFLIRSSQTRGQCFFCFFNLWMFF